MDYFSYSSIQKKESDLKTLCNLFNKVTLLNWTFCGEDELKSENGDLIDVQLRTLLLLFQMKILDNILCF